MYQKTLGLNDFYFGDDERRRRLSAREHPDGAGSHSRRCSAARNRRRPGWHRTGRSRDIAKHAIDFWLSTEDLPRADNRVTVDGEGRLTLSYTPTNEVPKQKLYKKLESILGKLDMNTNHLIHRFAYMKNDIPVAGVAHQAGTCRFGDDPTTSVLNRDCRAHELDNLYVVDTSVFPSIGAVNPALTAMANSLRVGDHLVERLG